MNLDFKEKNILISNMINFCFDLRISKIIGKGIRSDFDDSVWNGDLFFVLVIMCRVMRQMRQIEPNQAQK